MYLLNFKCTYTLCLETRKSWIPFWWVTESFEINIKKKIYISCISSSIRYSIFLVNLLHIYYFVNWYEWRMQFSSHVMVALFYYYPAGIRM